MRVTVHLDRASAESQLWASAYDRSVRDILSLQDEIARTVIDEIQVKLTAPERARLSSPGPVIRQNYVCPHIITLQRVHNGDAGRRVVGSQ
jgi:hypothetical protein